MALVDEENIENQTRGEPCSGLRKELKECILASDCVKMVGCCIISPWVHGDVGIKYAVYIIM